MGTLKMQNAQCTMHKWTPALLGDHGRTRCRRHVDRIRRSFASGSSSWSGAGAAPEALAPEFEPSAQSIRNWVAQADRDEGRRTDGLTTDERTELQRLRRENATLREEREILKKAAAWFARETGSIPSKGSDS